MNKDDKAICLLLTLSCCVLLALSVVPCLADETTATKPKPAKTKRIKQGNNHTYSHWLHTFNPLLWLDMLQILDISRQMGES